MIYDAVPNVRFGELKFGSSRSDIRKLLGNGFKEVKKSINSQNTMDVYNDYHVFYDANDKFEAIEVFGDVEILIEKHLIFPGTISNIKKIFPNLKDDGYGLTDIENSVAITVSQDDENKIDSILFGINGYYK